MDLRALTTPGLVPQLTREDEFPTSLRTLPRARECECPFVNRADPRCSAHLSLGGVEFAYDHCFDEYTACSLYAELEDERQTELTIKGRRRSVPQAA